MKILVISDTHGHLRNAIGLIQLIKPDRIIHLGDFSGDAIDIESIFERIPIDYVAGNCDFADSVSPQDKILKIQGKKIWITHGHHYQVKKNVETIIKVALEKNVDAVLFGHTHQQYHGIVQGIIMMNPGSLSIPKDGYHGGYGTVEIDDLGRLHATLCRL